MKIFIAPIAQWIEQTRPKGEMGVQLPLGAELHFLKRACSSVGRARDRHSRGHRFKSGQVHGRLAQWLERALDVRKVIGSTPIPPTMNKKIQTFLKPYLKENLPDLRPGDTVRVYQKIKEGDKERVQVFEGLVIARKHGKEIGTTFTVRKVIDGVGVEKIFPFHSPKIEKIEILRKGKVRRAKLYYLRKAKGKKARLQTKRIGEIGGGDNNEKISVQEESTFDQENSSEN